MFKNYPSTMIKHICMYVLVLTLAMKIKQIFEIQKERIFSSCQYYSWENRLQELCLKKSSETNCTSCFKLYTLVTNL